MRPQLFIIRYQGREIVVEEDQVFSVYRDGVLIEITPHELHKTDKIIFPKNE